MHGTSLPSDTFDKHSDCHTRRESMWVDDDIWLHARFAERHVDSWVFLRADTLLPVSRGELISDCRLTWYAQLDVHLLLRAIRRIIRCR